MSNQQNFVSIEALSRRDALRRIALGITAVGLAGPIEMADAHEVHSQASDEKTFKGEYTVKYFNAHEFKTLEKLSELIVPPDAGGPSGRDGGAPEFIDLLCSQNDELAAIFSGGILWLDHAMDEGHGKKFIDLSGADQTAMLDSLVKADETERASDTSFRTSYYSRFAMYGLRQPGDIRRGLRFFDWARRLIVDAYYTSPAGLKDIGYIGNGSYSEYEVPKKAIDYAMSRSPFKA